MTSPVTTRRDVAELFVKLRFLATNKQVRARHRLSMAGLSEACGKKKDWLKSATAQGRETKTIEPAVEQKLGELCGFDPAWAEWTNGTAAAFQRRMLGGARASPEELAAAALHDRIPAHLTAEELILLGKAKTGELTNPATEAKLAALSTEIGETRDVIVGFFRRLDEAEGLDEGWPAKLTRFAEDFRTLRAELKTLDPDDPDLKDQREQALAALDAGALDEAKALLRRIDVDRGGAIAKARKELVQGAEVKASLGKIALLEFSYPEAAAKCCRATKPRGAAAIGRLRPTLGSGKARRRATMVLSQRPSLFVGRS
jgi:hypothetical protein